MKNGKIIITVVAVAAAVVVALVLLFGTGVIARGDYTGSLRKGQEYYDSGDYEKAIVAFKTALEQNENGIEAYEGLAQSYLKGGYIALASETIHKGLMVSTSLTLKKMMEDLEAKEDPPEDNTQSAANEAKNENLPEQDLPLAEGLDGETLVTISGQILNASTGEPVSEVLVKAYQGYSDNGTPTETKTDSSGEYKLDLHGGDYYIVLEKEGFISESGNIYVVSNLPSQSFNFTVSEELDSSVIRLVLTWNEEPRDLDSYLVGTTGSGVYIKSCYYNRQSFGANGNLIAELDVDDLDGFGPETTTLYETAGSFTYRIRDYRSTGTMGSQGATVKIYKGSDLYETVTVPGDAVNAWDVCRIENGNITIVNAACTDDLF